MQLQDYLNVIKRRWWIAVIAMVIAAAVAFGYSSTQPKIYESSVQLRGQPGKPDAGLYSVIQQQLQSYTARFSSTDLANEINQRGGFDLSPDAILSKFHVQAQTDKYIFIITVDDVNPQRAKQIADIAADVLVDENLAAIEGLNSDQQIYIQKNSPASLPDKPSSPRTNLLTAAGAGLGLVLGLILMFVVEFFDNTLKDENDIKRYTNLEILGQIPRRRAKRNAPTATAPAFGSNGTVYKPESASEIKSK